MPSWTKVRVAGPLAPYAPGFGRELRGCGFTDLSTAEQLRLMSHLSRWIAREGLDVLGGEQIAAYCAARKADGGPPLPWTVTTLGSLGTGGTPMVTKYQKFADGYKAEAVKLYRESNQTIAETARNLGLKESTLANWVKKDKDNEAVAAGEAPLTPRNGRGSGTWRRTSAASTWRTRS